MGPTPPNKPRHVASLESFKNPFQSVRDFAYAFFCREGAELAFDSSEKPAIQGLEQVAAVRRQQENGDIVEATKCSQSEGFVRRVTIHQ